MLLVTNIEPKTESEKIMDTSKQTKAIELLKLLKFELQDDNCWAKTYDNLEEETQISVQLHDGSITFPVSMSIHNESTSRLNENEDFVVLECVDRLLTRGYPAHKIELEKTWILGRKEKGRLDVQVRSQENDEIYLMIECKTETTIDKEVLRTQNNGGQIFSYFQQDQSAKFLCLYASWIEKFKVNYQCHVVPVQDSFVESRSLEEVHNKWDKKFINDGVFGENVQAYKVEF